MVKGFKFLTQEKIYVFIKWFIWVTLGLALVGAIADMNFFVIFISVLTFILTLTPYILKEKFHVKLPQTLELVIILFLYATLFLGEVQDYYNVFWWWDVLMHGIAALALGFIGVGFLYELDKKTVIKANPLSLVFFGFCFAVAIGTIWEIIEFTIDQFFGTNMQKSGLMDTMGDLIVTVVGGFIVAFFGFFYLRKQNKKF
jgi:hypothetical protein